MKNGVFRRLGFVYPHRMAQHQCNQTFYSAFGCLTSAFAHMEADLRFLIAGLAFRGETEVAAAFLDGSHLSGNLSILKKLGLTFVGDEAQFHEIVKHGEKIRLKRNLFIHGLWSPGNFGEKDGLATVKDLRTKTEEVRHGRQWTHGISEQFSLADFENLLSEVNLISAKIEKLCAWLEKHEDIDFGYFGATSKSTPTKFLIKPDGSLTPVSGDRSG